MTLKVSGTDVVKTDRSFVLGTATPVSPTTGMIRWSTTNSRFEVYNGTAWVAILTVATSTPPLWSWGAGSYGKLGNNSLSDRSSPGSVVGGFTDWVRIVSSQDHSAAIRANGTAWAWGYNYRGEVGDNTTTRRSSPVSVVGGITDWIQISAGNRLTAAIRANGTAWAWGDNGNGQLGDNTTTRRSSPVSVVGGITDWIQISAGRDNISALRANGTAWSWGRNHVGQLGNNSTTNRSSPVSVVGGFTDWVQISAGSNHTVALRANGTAWAWGENSNGQLGNGTNVVTSSPVSVVGGFTNWVQVSAGGAHTAAIRANGTAWAWGAGSFGRLGDGTIVTKSSPVSVVGGFTDWVQVSAGGGHIAAIRANGTAWAWGINNYGQLGDNTTVSKSSPVSVVGGFTDWIDISCGNQHTMALRAV